MLLNATILWLLLSRQVDSKREIFLICNIPLSLVHDWQESCAILINLEAVAKLYLRWVDSIHDILNDVCSVKLESASPERRGKYVL